MVEGGINPDYFWNELTDTELYYITKRVNDNRVEVFERTRLLAYVIVRALGGNIEYDDFLNTNEGETPGQNELTQEQIKERINLLIEAYKRADYGKS